MKRRRTSRVAFSLAFVLTMVSGATLASCTVGPSTSGVSGRTVVDVGCPVLRVSETCAERPLSARVTVMDSKGVTVGEATSNDRGEFRIALHPGTYDLRASNLSGGPLPYASPAHLIIRSGSFTELVVKFDSGIR